MRVHMRPNRMTHEILQRHRCAWARKPVLRRVYRRYFRDILDRCAPLEPIVELGCGAGFFKEFCPDAIATDLEETPWTDRTADCCNLPFGDRSIGNLVMIDVFHHLADPRAFLEEAARVLLPGGRVVMLEPWTSVLGYQFYRRVHQEVAERQVDTDHPFPNGKEAFQGNPALPELFFQPDGVNPPRGELKGRLEVREVRRLPALSWLFTGGFSPYCLLPEPLLCLADMADRLADPLAGLCALRALITLQRPVERPVLRTAGVSFRPARHLTVR